MKNLKEKKLIIKKKYELWSIGGYMTYPNYGNKFLQSFFLFFCFISRIWNNLSSCSQSNKQIDFKTQLKIDMKPVQIKYFSIGPKVGNSILTKFRTGRTSLNLHIYNRSNLYISQQNTLKVDFSFVKLVALIFWSRDFSCFR
jgi:hypothetical protein